MFVDLDMEGVVMPDFSDEHICLSQNQQCGGVGLTEDSCAHFNLYFGVGDHLVTSLEWNYGVRISLRNTMSWIDTIITFLFFLSYDNT